MYRIMSLNTTIKNMFYAVVATSFYYLYTWGKITLRLCTITSVIVLMMLAFQAQLRQKQVWVVPCDVRKCLNNLNSIQ